MKWTVLDTSTPFVIAHRGGNECAPENSFAAFSDATSIGVDFIETDVQLTSDGVLVIFHDSTLERLLGVPVKVNDISWKDLSELQFQGQSVMTLEHALEAFPDVRFNIDPKSDRCVEPLLDLIQLKQAENRVCIGSFSDRRIRRVCSDSRSQLCTSAGPHKTLFILLSAFLFPFWKPRFGCLQIPSKRYRFNLSSRFLISRLHKMGLQVHYWTINEESEMKRLINNGADAIITDKPRVLLEVLGIEVPEN